MTDAKNRVCPVERAGALDSGFRRWLQNPRKILGPYVREGMTVLDAGCGPGFFSVEMAAMVGPGGKVIAADLQEEMLDKLRAKVRGTPLEAVIKPVKCGKESLNVSERVDFALAFFVVHEITDKERFFSELKSILRETGRVLVAEPRPFHVSKTDFEATLRTAENAGFAFEPGPGLFLCHCAALRPRRAIF